MALASFTGVVIGLGLGLLSNVSGVVLALYGLVLGALCGAVVLTVSRRRR